MRPTVRFSASPASVRRQAPVLGEDNASVLGELGYSAEEIDDMLREGVLARAPARG